MPQLAHKTQPKRPAAWAMYNPTKAVTEDAMAKAPGPTDDEIERIAQWYAEREFGRFAIESDYYDKTIN